MRPDNHGLGLSILEGVLAARGQIIVGMDADFNHEPADLPKLISGLGDKELRVASRFVTGGGMSDQWRFWPTLGFNALFRLFGFPIWDNTSGYYAIHRANLLSLQPEKIYYGYGDYHLRLLHAAKKEGYNITEVPTFYRPRPSGQSKSKLLPMAVSYLKEAWRLSKI